MREDKRNIILDASDSNLTKVELVNIAEKYFQREYYEDDARGWHRDQFPGLYIHNRSSDDKLCVIGCMLTIDDYQIIPIDQIQAEIGVNKENANYYIDTTGYTKTEEDRGRVLKEAEVFFGAEYFQTPESWDWLAFPGLILASGKVTGRGSIYQNQKVITPPEVRRMLSSESLFDTLNDFSFKEELI